MSRHDTDSGTERQRELGWRTLPPAAQLYLAAVIAAGAYVVVTLFPRTYPRPLLFVILMISSCLTSAWKVNLPIALTSGSTLSMSYAANLMALLLLGPSHAMLVAVAGAWTQCTYKVKRSYPLYRTVFSTCGEALTMAATGLVYGWLGGPIGPVASSDLAEPLVGAIAAYFLVNTGLVAAAISLSTRQNFAKVWRDDFLWSGASFMVAGSAGAMAAIVVDRGEHWKAVLMLAPVHLTYRTYQLFIGRLDDQKRHVSETQQLHEKAVEALDQARKAEQALADEKERLAIALADMTRLEQARVHLLEREQAARASAENANRVKDQFLATVSHELRTPLNAILGWSEMLHRGKLKDPQRERAYQAIHSSAKRQAQLVEDLLDVARIMSGKLRLERTAVDVTDVVRDALQVVQPAAEARRIHITVDADPAAGTIYADSARLQQITWNLLSNAVKFTPEGGDVRVRLTRRDDVVEMVVTDTGKGISPDFLPWVFEPFRQADGSTTRLQAGLGLGLSIVKHIVEAHSGTVKVESAGLGHGATFVVHLPTVPGALDSERSGRRLASSISEQPEASASLEGLSVLIVDDDDDSRQVVAAHLAGRHAEVLTAASAAQAFAVLERQHVDVLLSDIAMPGEDGYTLIRRLRASTASEVASIPAAALTAFARDEDRQHALQAGFQLHLAKPIDAQSLIAAVANLSRVHLT